jgi:putative tryptophan/tyrosine transport system substrate-binding protein
VDRRRFLLTSLAAAVAAPLAADAQKARKVHRIGVLSSASSQAPPAPLEGLRQGLHELGWIEGYDIVIDYRFAEGHDRLPALAAELVRLKLDIIVALATPATAAAKNATATIPIVMMGAGDPVGSGFVANIARPGGNVTGLTFSGAGMGVLAKQLELLMEALPKVRRVAILSNPTNPNHRRWMEEIKDASRSLRVQLQLLEAEGPNEFEGAFAAMAKGRAGALLVAADSVFIRHPTRLAALAAKTRLPALGQHRELVEAGGLMSYAPSHYHLGQRAATYVDKILKGAKPTDLPVEQPNKLELVLNLRTAKALGLTIPPSLLARADQVIE